MLTQVRRSRYIQFLCITVVVIILITTATRPQYSSTLENEREVNIDQRANFIKQVEDKILNWNKNYVDVNQIDEAEMEEENNKMLEDDTPIPFNDRMPAAYLRFNEPAETNKSYCKYNYDFPYDLDYIERINASSPEQGMESQYRTLYNVVEAYDVEKAVQVTYASHMTANFAYFLPELLRYWEGLIVIAAFVPDLDTALFLEQINQYCYCEPEMYRVSIHIVTHKTVPFLPKNIYFERPGSCVPKDSSKIAIYTDHEETMVYPVNVLRNIARTSVLTKYILLSDIELMPSRELASQFLKLIAKDETFNQREVFVVPLFEVEDTESIPENKRELLSLMKDNKAVYFHKLVCEHCQKFPGIEQWLTNGFSDELKPLLTVKRQRPHHRWEPIFIGTNEEPLYSELLSWEGLQDKMTQSLEMCLLDYNYTILDNTFLCHWPGIKKQKVASEQWRLDYVLENKAVYKGIIKGFHGKYVDIPKCMVNKVARLTKNVY